MFSLALALLLSVTVARPTDIVHLRDGSRYLGHLEAEEPGAVLFRVLLPDGTGSFVCRFPLERVLRLERNVQHEPTSRPVGGDDTAAEVGPDWEQVLREAFELLDDGDAPAALRALQKLVRGAPSAELAELAEACRAARGVPLDVLLAQTRIRVAAGPGDGGFRIPYATPYETAALGRLLAELQNQCLQRSCDGRTVAEWAAARSEYVAVQPESRPLVATAARAVALISVRLRLDPELENARAARAGLVALAADLSQLAAHVRALPGFTAPPEDSVTDPAEQVVQQLAAGAAATSRPAGTGSSSTEP